MIVLKRDFGFLLLGCLCGVLGLAVISRVLGSTASAETSRPPEVSREVRILQIRNGYQEDDPNLRSMADGKGIAGDDNLSGLEREVWRLKTRVKLFPEEAKNLDGQIAKAEFNIAVAYRTALGQRRDKAEKDLVTLVELKASDQESERAIRAYVAAANKGIALREREIDALSKRLQRSWPF